jgi:hypothetical protein
MQSRFYDSLVNLPPSVNELLRLKELQDSHYIDVDFSGDRPEAAWQVWVDRLCLNAVPVWFDWLKWVMMLAALKVIAVKSGSPMVGMLQLFSSVLMYFYFLSFVMRFRIKGLSLIGSEKGHFIVSLILSFLLSSGIYWCAIWLAEAVAAMSK